MWQKLKPYIIFVGSALAVGGLSALVTGNSMDNYARLVQPPFAPPGWLFPVVWTALFILMGIGVARVYIAGGPYRSVSLALFFTQLAVNFCWSIFFFRLEARRLCLAVAAADACAVHDCGIQKERQDRRPFADPLYTVAVLCRLPEPRYIPAEWLSFAA